MAKEVNSASFATEVMQSTIPVVVDFWAPWCGPCRSQSPILESFAAEMEGVAKVVKINTDDNQDLAAQFGIMSIPTIMVFKNGVMHKKAVGVQPLQNLKELIK